MRKIFLMFTLCLMSYSVLAQRTVEGQFFVQGQCSFIQGATPRAGFGIYRSNGCWQFDAGVLFERDPKDLTVGIDGGYNWRLYGTSNRLFSLYGGVGGSFGYLVADKAVETPTDDKFVLGLYPKLELELFPFQTVALFVSGSTQYVFYLRKAADGEPVGRFFPEVSAGLRFML